jgi:hypothetical protein
MSAREQTFYTRAGDWFAWLALLCSSACSRFNPSRNRAADRRKSAHD